MVVTMFPAQRLFTQKLADPLEVQLSARYLTSRTEFAGNIGYSAGLLQMSHDRIQLQLRVEGNALLVSKLHRPDFPVQSTDFTLAFPLEFRKNRFSARLKWMHISSHLGDDFNRIDGVRDALYRYVDRQGIFLRPRKYSREYVELLTSYNIDKIRFYGGPSLAYHVTANEPNEPQAQPWTLQLGIEVFSARAHAAVQPYAAVDVKLKQEFGWTPDFNAQLGLFIGGQAHKMRLALEFFKGHSNQGQFSQRKEQDVNLLIGFDL